MNPRQQYGVSPASTLGTGTPGRNRNVHCAYLGRLGSIGRLPNPKTLKRVRLLVDAGPGRPLKAVPIVVNDDCDRGALAKAMRVGSRFFGERFRGAATGNSIRFFPA